MASEQSDLSEDYRADSVQVFKGLEHIRTRPCMYIGDIGPEGLHGIVFQSEPASDRSSDATSRRTHLLRSRWFGQRPGRVEPQERERANGALHNESCWAYHLVKRTGS
jgi:hypothetical protein